MLIVMIVHIIIGIKYNHCTVVGHLTLLQVTMLHVHGDMIVRHCTIIGHLTFRHDVNIATAPSWPGLGSPDIVWLYHYAGNVPIL